MIKSKFSVSLAIFLTLFFNVQFVLPNQVQAAGSSADSSHLSYAVSVGWGYIGSYLTNYGCDVYMVADILNYLNTHGYFAMSIPMKKAFLTRMANERQVYFWRITTQIIQVENANRWNAAASNTTDYVATACFSNTVRNNAQAAGQFFLRNFCNGFSSSDPTNRANYLDKSKWSSSQLDTLYNTYWPDLKNQRYRPGFTPQETNNLTTISALLSQRSYVVGGTMGASCDKINDPGLRSDDGSLLTLFAPLAGLFSTSEVVAVARTATANLSDAETVALAREATGISPLASPDEELLAWWRDTGELDVYMNTHYPNLKNRWTSSGTSSETWISRDNEQLREWLRSSQGRLYNMSEEEARKFYYDNISFFSANRMDSLSGKPVLATAPLYHTDGTISTMEVNANFLSKFMGSDLGDAYSHEYIHFRKSFASGGVENETSVRVGDEFLTTLEKRGFGDVQPLDEGITEYLSLYHRGKLNSRYSILARVFISYRPFAVQANRIVERIMAARGCSYDEAVRLLDDIWIGHGNEAQFFYRLFHYGDDTKTGIGFISDITGYLASGDNAALNRLFSIPVVRGQL